MIAKGSHLGHGTSSTRSDTSEVGRRPKAIAGPKIQGACNVFGTTNAASATGASNELPN